MSSPLQVTMEGDLDARPAVRFRIEREAAKLGRFYDRITSCRVEIVAGGPDRPAGDVYAVRLLITDPGEPDLAIDLNPRAYRARVDPCLAVRDAFAAARRRLQDRRRKLAARVAATST